MTRRAVLSLFAPALAAALAGCGSGRPEPVPAGGTVTFRKSVPAAGALVVFHPTDPAVETRIGGKPVGRVADDGTFKLTMYADGDGAPEGEYGVTVDWRDKPKPGTVSLSDGGGAGAPKLKPQYGTPQAPFAKVTVKRGEANRFDFDVD